MKKFFSALFLAASLSGALAAVTDGYFAVSGDNAAAWFGTLTNSVAIPGGNGQTAIDQISFTTVTNGCELAFYKCIGISSILRTNLANGTNVIVSSTNVNWNGLPALILDVSSGTWIRTLIGDGASTNSANGSASSCVMFNTNGCRNYGGGTQLTTGDKIYVMHRESTIPIWATGRSLSGQGILSISQTNANQGVVGALLTSPAMFVGAPGPTNLVMVQLHYRIGAPPTTVDKDVTNIIHHISGRYLGAGPY